MNLEHKRNNNTEIHRLHHLAETNIDDVIVEIPTSEQQIKTDETAVIEQKNHSAAEKPVETRYSSCHYSPTGDEITTRYGYDELRKDEYVAYEVDDKYKEPVDNRG